MASETWPRAGYNTRAIVEREHERLVEAGQGSGLIGEPSLTATVYGDSTGRQVKVRAARFALVRGQYYTSGASDIILSIAANAGATRKDLVVLRLARDTGSNTTSWKVTETVITGTSGSPAPAPTQQVTTDGTGVWDLPLAIVTVGTGVSTIAAGDVQFIGPYLNPQGAGYRVSSIAALAYVPEVGLGVETWISDTTGGSPARPMKMIYNGSAWVPAPGTIVAELRYAAAGTVALSASTWTDLPMDTEDYDPFDGHSLVTNTDRWVAPWAGTYLTPATASFAGTTAGRRGVRVTVNDAEPIGQPFLTDPIGSQASFLHNNFTPLRLAASEYLTACAFSSNAVNAQAPFRLTVIYAGM